MAKPDGSIIETPITANFREGLERPAVLHLDARRAQGSRRYGVEDRELGLPDASPRRRRAGPRRHRASTAARPRACSMTPIVEGGDVVEPLRERVLGPRRRGRRARAGHRRGRRSRPARCSTRARSRSSRRLGVDQVLGALADHVRDALRRLRAVLRARPRSRPPRQHRRGGRRHRGAVDRRAGHAAHDAYVPHRWRGVACGGGRTTSRSRARARSASST